MCSTSNKKKKPFVPLRWLAAVVILPCLVGAVWASPYSSGQELAQAVYDRPDGDTSFAVAQMFLTEKGRQPRARAYFSFGEEKANGEKASLIRFKHPEDVSGTGLLTKDYADNRSDQWLYLPELNKVRRIASSGKASRFVGSDIYYEDLEDRKVAEDRHTILGEQAVNGMACTELQSVPVDAKSSIYTRRVSCIHRETLLPLRVHLYNKKGLIKTVEVLRIEKVQDYWTVMDYLVTDAGSGHETRVVMDKVVYDMPFEKVDVFSPKVLEDPTLDERLSRHLIGS